MNRRIIVLCALAILGACAPAQRVHAEGYILSCDTMVGMTCFVAPLVNPYVRQVPQPTSDEDKEAQRQRDMLWVHECSPELVRDRYGVSRYHYNDPGCVFGSHP